MKAKPDEKGPWVEGDLFTSNFEGSTRVEEIPGGGDRVAVQFDYTENGQTFVRQDDVWRKREGGVGWWMTSSIAGRLNSRVASEQVSGLR